MTVTESDLVIAGPGYPKIQTIWKRDERGRIQEGRYSSPELEYLAANEWEFTEKVDGTNIRINWNPAHEQLEFAGRTDRADIPPFLLERLNALFTEEKLAEVLPVQGGADPDTATFTLYGEGYGARIQKGGGNYIADGVDFVLFDIKAGPWWLLRPGINMIAERLGIEAVPVLGIGTLAEACEMASIGFPSARWAGVTECEGLVLRPAVEMFSRAGDRILTKIKTRDYRP